MAYDLEEQEQIDAIKAWWEQYGKLIHTLKTKVPNIHKAVISCHCHDDLGLAGHLICTTLAPTRVPTFK